MVHYAHPEFQEFGLGQQETTSTPQVTQQVTQQVTPQVTPQVEAILRAAVEPRTRAELMTAAKLNDRKHFAARYLDPLLRTGWLAMTTPDKPRSSLQRYRTTQEGANRIGRRT